MEEILREYLSRASEEIGAKCDSVKVIVAEEDKIYSHSEEIAVKENLSN